VSERYFFNARSYQKKMREARKAGCRRFLCLWHRRAGKDRNGATFCLEEMLLRPGVYFHIFPALNQGRRDFWNNQVEIVNEHGRTVTINMVDACFPPEIVKRKINDEMIVELRAEAGGGMYQIMGADDDEAVARLRGPNPFGLIFSEWAHGKMMPRAWETLSPVLAENNGWAAFLYTPHGQNHGQALYNMACNNLYSAALNRLGWFVQKLTVEDTRRDAFGENGGPVVTPEQIQAEIKEGKRPEYIREEYWCDFTGFEHGTIYGDLMRVAENENRICDIPCVYNQPVGVLFDLGTGQSDLMVMWFYQRYNGMIHFIDYVEGAQKDLKWAAHEMREKRNYLYGRIVLPWDGRAAEEYFTQIGFRNVHFVERRVPNVQESIEQVRRQFNTFRFDRTRCARGIECLIRYARKYDEQRQIFEKPIHDQYSHGADALRTGVEGGFEPLTFSGLPEYREVKVITEFDPRSVPMGVM